MTQAIVWMKHTLSMAYEVFGSASCAELGEITILCILGMIASMLVITPGDQSSAAIYTLCHSIAACY